MPKLLRTDAADIYKIANGLYFASTDKGNFLIVQKDSKDYIEPCDSTLHEVCTDYEVNRPIYVGIRCLADYFKNLQER